MSTAKEKAIERARYWVAEEIKWIEHCGGNAEGYLAKYEGGGYTDQNIIAIYESDLAALDEYRRKLSDLVPPERITVERVTVSEGHTRVVASCGHAWGYAGVNTPKPGDRTDCMNCDMRRQKLRGDAERAAKRRVAARR